LFLQIDKITNNKCLPNNGLNSKIRNVISPLNTDYTIKLRTKSRTKSRIQSQMKSRMKSVTSRGFCNPLVDKSLTRATSNP